jgi:putative ABC transport system permease protein
MRVLDVKLLRDLKRLWAQALAIALVLSGGVVAILVAVGSYRSLEETRAAYYESYRFADVFATARRAPKSLVGSIAEIPGVIAVETRISSLALLDIPDVREPATGRIISLPASGQPALNRIHLRLGRLPDPARPDEIVVNESFARAHRFVPGAQFSAILNGRKRALTIVGVALSPEFVYAIGPGDVMPDDRRFAVIWMAERPLAAIYGLEGAFSSVSLGLARGASEQAINARLDAILEPYGGSPAYGRRDQASHAFLEHSLDMLRNMSRTLPPIFLLVGAFLVSLTLGRLVTLDREQIGLLKAVGYANATIAAHYLKLVIGIAAFGILIGSAAGTWIGARVTALYADFFRFPFLVFAEAPELYLAAATLSLVAGGLGAVRAVHEIVALQPAVAMQQAPPARFRRLPPEALPLRGVLPQPAVMTFRGLTRRPVRASLTLLGMAMSSGILIVSLFISDTTEELIGIAYFLADRQDATVSFVDRRPERVVFEMKRLPGVLAAEPVREVAVRIRSGDADRAVILRGSPPDADLSRVIDSDLQPVALPESGVAISAWLADILGVRVGDVVEVDLLAGARRTVPLVVAARVEDFFGINAAMDGAALARLMREAPAADAIHLSLDPAQLDALYAAIKDLPSVSGIALQRVSLANYRETMVVVTSTMTGIDTGLAAVIAFGVVYNSARISLSERARELASLRVLGFTRAEVFRILLLELALLTALAQPPGWAIGYALARLLNVNMAAEVMRSPFVIEPSTYVMASAIVIAAALLSALVVRGRINRLDLVSVLKARE